MQYIHRDKQEKIDKNELDIKELQHRGTHL